MLHSKWLFRSLVIPHIGLNQPCKEDNSLSKALILYQSAKKNIEN